MFNTELDQNNQPMKGSAGYFNLDDLGKVPHRPSRPAPVVTPNFPTQAAESVPMETPENYEYYQSAPLTPNNQAAGDMEYNEQWGGGVVSDAAQFLFRGIGGGLYKALWQGVGQVGALMQSDMVPEMFGSVDKANAQSEYVFGNALTELSDKMVGMAPKVHSASRFDAGYWTEGTGTVFSTLAPYLIGLGTAKGAQALLKMLGAGTKLTAAGATLTSAVAMRHAENYTEAAQVYKNIFDEAVANGDSYDVASQKAGEGAAETYKLDWLNLGFDLFQMASILKPLKVITRNEGMLTGTLAKAAGRNNPWFKEIAGRAAKFGALESMSEGVEEMVNEIAQAEGKDGQPMDGNFLQAWGDIIMNRGSKYMSDAKVWDSFIFGTMGGAVAQLGFGALNKESRLKLQAKLTEIAERANDTKQLINDYAANQGNDADFYMSKRRSMAKFAMRAVEAGNVDLALEQLDDTEGLAQTLGIDPKELAKSDNLRQELKDQILWTERAYKRYGSHSLFTNSDYYNALRDTSIAMSAQIRANGQALNYVNESTTQLKDDMGFSTLSPIATQYLDITEEAIAIEAKLKSIEPMLRDVNNPEYATYRAFANRLQRRQDQINNELEQINETLKTPQRVDSTNTVEVSNLKELNDALSRFRSKDLIQAKAFGLDIALDNDLLSEALNTLETEEGVKAFEDEIRAAQREHEKAIDDTRRKAKDEKKRQRAEDSRKEAEATTPAPTTTTPESTVTPETPEPVVSTPAKGTEEPEVTGENANSIILKTPAQTEATNSIVASFSEVRSSADLRIVDAGSAIAWLHLPYDVVTGPDGNPSLVTDPKQGVNTEIQDHRIYLKEFFGAGTPLTLEVDSTHPHYALALEQEKARGLDGMLVPIAVKSQGGTTVGYLHTIDWIRPFTTVETTSEGGDNIALQRTILRRMREAVIAQGSISAFVSNKSLGHIEFNETRTTVADAIKSPEVSMAIAKDGELYLDRDRKVSADLLVDKNKLVSGLSYLVVPTNVSGKFAVLPVDTIKLSNTAVETMAKAIEIFCNADEEVHLDLLNASDGEFNLLQASSLRSILERFIYTTNLNEENSAKVEKDKKSDKIYVAVRSNGIDFQRAGYPKLILTRELYGRNKAQFDANLKEFMQQAKNLYFKLNLTDALKESTTFPQYDSATNSWNVTSYKYQDYMRMVTSTKYREESTVVDGKTYYTHFFQPNIHIQLTPGSITTTEPVSEKQALEHDLEMLILKAFGEPGHTVEDLMTLADTLRSGEDPEFDQIVAEAKLIIDDIKALSTSPGSTLSDKIADIERRRQEELKKQTRLGYYYESDFKHDWQKKNRDEYLKDPIQFLENSISIAKENLKRDPLNRISQNVINDSQSELDKIREINAKYDAELAALEGAKPIASVSGIEAKKADIEKRRQEEIDNLFAKTQASTDKQLNTPIEKISKEEIAKRIAQAKLENKDLIEELENPEFLNSKEREEEWDKKADELTDKLPKGVSFRIKDGKVELFDNQSYRGINFGGNKIVQVSVFTLHRQNEKFEVGDRLQIDDGVQAIPAEVTKVNENGKVLEAKTEEGKLIISKGNIVTLAPINERLKINAKYDAELKRIQEESTAKESGPNIDDVIGDLGLEVSASLDYVQVSENEVQYTLKALSILQSNKAIEAFSKANKNNWSLEKTLTELQVPKVQKELILSLGVNSREEIITNLLANYSYTVEINTGLATTSRQMRYFQDENQVLEEEVNTPYDRAIIQPDGSYKVILVDAEGEEFSGGNFKTKEEVINEYGDYIFDKSKSLPKSQYYSNLTVPGGTNYTEQEIATPAITPSIKGHAQFSTDKGIGWFRSDDKDATKIERRDLGTFEVVNDLYTQEFNAEKIETTFFKNGKQITKEEYTKANLKQPEFKTRRILEVQSDLFQKGRDKEDLTNNIDLRKKNKRLEEDLYGSGFDELLKERNQAIINSKNSSENQFLQLLNKDNNWVTFFVKSIIQDSAKKGYEKVLFPTGNTASKVEGHTTLEEFKKQKEDRIKELEESKTKEKYNFTDDYGQVHTVKTDLEKINREINQLKQELERLETEGFGALRPIFNFYENTVTNILKKQGYNPVLVTDEYGNTWNEVAPEMGIISLSPEDSREYLPKNYLIDPKNFDGYKQNTVVNLMMASVLNWVQQDRTISVYQAFDRLKTAYSKLAEHPSYKDKFQPILNNFNSFKSLTLDRLEQLEFLDIAKKFNDRERFANDTDTAPDERYDQDAMSIDPKDSVSGRLRMFLSFVKSDKPSYLGEQFPEYMQYDDVMNTAHTILNGVPGSYQEMINALRNQTTRFPWINSLIDKLESPNTSELVRNEFVMAMRKQYAKHYMVNWSEWRINSKEGFTVNVISSDQSGIATVIYDSWYDNLANSSMVHLVDGSFVLDAAKRKAFVDRMPSVREEAIKGNMEPLNTWLQEIGVKLSPAALEALKNPGKARVFKDLKTTASLFDSKNGVFYNIVQRLTAGEKAGEDTLALNNPYINNSGMMQLASLEAQYRTNIFSNSFRNANNDQVYSYAMPSFLSDRVEMLINNDVELENLSNDVFAKNSTFLAQLKNKESFLRRHFNVSYADGIVKTHSNADGVKIEDMSPTEYMIYALGLHANSALGEPGAGRKIGHYLLPTFSDKKRKAIITTAKHDTKIIFNSFKKEITGFGPETKAAIENIVDSEINRMLAFKGHPDPAYSTGYKYFYLLPSLNNIEAVFDSDHVYIDSPENRTILYQEALSYVKQLILRRYSQFKNAGIIEEVEGQRYDPKTKSNINGTHDILNYVDSRYLKDIVDMNINSINQQGLYVAADYVINNLIVNTNMYQLVFGDPAMYFKGDKKDTSIDAQINSTYDNIGKRLAMMIAPGHSIAESDSDTIKYAFFKDDEDVSKNYTEIEKILKAHNLDPKPYTQIEGTDAQEYTTLKEHLHVLNLMGRISKSQMGDILSRSSSETLTDEDLHVIFQPIKPVYSNVIFESETNTSRVLYVKSSSFPLFKQLTKGHSIDNLREAMEQEGVDRVAYKTAVKVGSRALVSAFDSNHDFKSVDELRSELSSKQQPYVSRKGFRIQQEVPYDPSKAEATKGTQETKLLFLDILDLDGFQYNGKEYSAKDLKAIYEDLHKTLYGLKSEKFYKRFYTKQGKLDIKQLKEMMVDEARSRGMSKYDIDSLETYIDTNNEEAFLMPLHSHPLADKFESLLLSLIDKQIIKQKMPGKSYVLGSELGFRLIETSSNPSASYPGIVYVPGYDPSKGLRSQTEDGKPAQVIAPFKFRNRNGELEDVRKYVVDGKLDTNKIPKELLQIFGFRIPTQGHNSMSYIEIVGFLPPNAGDLLIAPKDFTKQMGSDFDIDKLFSYVYNTRAIIDEEALSTLLSTFKDTKKAVFSAMLPETKKAFEKLLEARREAISAKDISRLQEVNESLSELIYSSPALASLRDEIEAVKSNILRWERDDSTEIKATQNAILDIHFSVLKNKGVFPNIMSPLGFGDTDSLAREIVALRKERRSKGTNPAIANFRPSLISEEYYQDKYFNGIVGKAMTGIKSLDSTFNAAIQGKGMYFRTYTEDGVEMPDGISFEGQSLYDLSGVTSLDGKNKSYHIAGYQSAAVDNEKEQILGKLNSNPITAAAERAIAQVGWPAEYSALLTSQDIILEFVDVSRRLSDSTSSVAGDRKELAIMEITERWLKKLGDPNYIADKDTPVSRDEMREMIKNGGKQYPNYFKHQLDLFAKFIDATTKGEALGDIQRAINTDSAGLGKNFIEVISKAESVKSSVMYNRVVANSVNVLGKPITDEDGRVVGIDFNTINGYATQYGLLPASTIFNNLFPYNSSAVRRVYKELANTLGYTQRGKAISDKVKKDVWNASKSFIFSDESVWGGDPNELRNNLLFSTGTVDQNGNRTITSKSLAVRVKEYSETVKGSKNIFLSKLSYDITPDLTTPDFIKYAATKGENYDETNTYQGLIDLLIDPESKELAADLIKYSYLTGGIQQAINFVRYIPTSYLEHVGLADLVRKVDYKSIDLFGDVPSLTMGSSRFVTQFIQHNPAMAPKITNKDIKEGIFASRFEERNGLPDIFTLPPIGNNIAAKLVMTYSTPEGSVQSYPKFIAIPDKTSNTKFRLYTLVPTKDGSSAYFAIDTLGGKYKTTEYSNKELIGNSTIEANTAPYTDAVKANIGNRMIKAVVTNTEDASYKSKFELFSLKEGDSFDIVDTLNTIKNISTNPYHVELATVYSKLLPLVNNTLKGIIENKAQRAGSYYHPGNAVGHSNVLAITNNRDISQHIFEKVFLHELSHALTVDILDRVLNGKVEGITDEQIKAANRLVKLYNHLVEGIESGKYEEYGLNKEIFKKFKEVNQRRKNNKASDEDIEFLKSNKRYYSFINIYELIAESMSSSETRTLLSSIPYSDGNFVSKIIDLIKRILKSVNIQTGTAYAEAVDSIFSLMGVTETNEAKEPRMPIENKPKAEVKNYYEGDITPDANTIFVFGSNPQGRHGAGAAKIAVQKFGAIYGQGEGLQGNAYALPTKDLTVKENNSLKSIDEKAIIESIKKLYRVAEQNPTKQFKIAYRNTDKSSLNGYTGLEMIQMFKAAGNIPSNIIFSKEWVDTGLFNEGERSDFFLDEIDLETETSTESAFVDPIIKQYQLRRQNILNAISKARTNKDIKRVAQLDKELKQLSKAITDLKTIELVDTALLQAEDELKAVGKALSTELSYSELNNLADIIYLWKDLREHLQDYMNFKKDSPLYKTISERIDNIEKEAFSLAKIHMKMAKQVINKAVRSASTREVGNVTDPKEDIGYWRGNFLDISRSQDPLLQAVDKICTQVAYDQTDEYREFQAELEEVFKDFYKSRYYQDGKFTKFLQVDDKGNKTGRLVSPYSHDYYRLYGHYKGKVLADPSDIKAYANYMRFLRKNVVMFDVRALFYSMYKAHGGTEVFTTEDIKAREDYLKSVLGETRYNIELERQRERLSKWEMDLAGYKLSIEDSEELSDLEKNAAIESFIRLRSPFEFMKVYADPSLDVSVKESITGDRYLIGIPRKTVDGKDTSFYDSSYLEIERDPILLHTYESIVTFMNRYVGYLPEHLTYDIRPNFLPILTKSESGVLHGTLDNYATYGMKAIPAGLRDAWVDAITQNIGGDYTRNTIDPVTGKERPDFTFNFLSKNPDLDPLPEDRSYDIPMLIDKFAKQAIFYKHRSRVQDMLYLANTVSSELKESTITPKGNPMINWITRKLHVTTGLDNNRQALEYYISAFHGNKREIEGATKKKMLTAADKRKQMALIAELELVEERLARHSTVGLMKRKAQLEKAIDEIGKNFTWGRLGDTILQYSQIRGMGWNPVSAANNITWGLLSNLMHAAGEQDYTMVTFRKAYAKMLNVVTPGKLRELGPEMFKEATKLHNLVYQFDVIKEINEAEYSSMVDNSRVLKGISKEFNPFEMHRKGEYLNQGVNLIAILMTEKITDVKGNERSFYEAFNTDGSWNTEEFGERPTERINALRMKTDQLNKRIHGNYDPNSPLRFKRMFIGRAIMQFRSWIPEAYQTRFEATNYDERLGREVKGRYRSFGAYFDSSTPYYKSIGKATGALAVEMANIATLRKITALNKYGAETAGEAIDVANMRMNAMDGLILSALLITFKILKNMWDADDDDKNKNKIMLAMNIINRLENDAMFFYNPLAIESIVQSTIPATKLLVDVSKLLDALYDDIVLDEDYILTGPAAGKAKVPYRVGKLVPGIAGYLRYEGSQEKMDN